MSLPFLISDPPPQRAIVSKVGRSMFNRQRNKTKQQDIREGKYLQKIERVRAKERQTAISFFLACSAINTRQ